MRKSSIGLLSVLLSFTLVVIFAVASVSAANSDDFRNGQVSLSALVANFDLLTEYFNFPPADSARFLDHNGLAAESIGDSGAIASRTAGKSVFSDDVVFEQFDNWVKNFIERDNQATDEQATEGEQLARLRRASLKQLIANDPRAALNQAMTAELIKQLPAYITDNSERRLNGTGNFMVYTSDEFAGSVSKSARGTKSAIQPAADWRTVRTVELDGVTYHASVYGRRESMTTKMGIPMQGIAIDSEMAVDESPAQKIDKTRARAEIGGRTMYFADEQAMAEYIDEQIKWESVIGPTRPTSAAIGQSPESSAEWTQGAKTIQVIRVDFTDKPGEPIGYDGQVFTLERAQSIYAMVNQFFFNNSYGKTSITATVTPTVVTMPKTLAYYRQNYDQSTIVNVMSADARAAAQDKGYSGNYDFDVVAFSNGEFPTFRGLSNTGAKGSLLSGALSFREIAHELGHNYGLEHASLWQTTDGTIIGKGSHIDYGDCFDMMADCNNLNINSHFNVAYKKLLNWLTDENVEPVTTTRESVSIYAQDYSSSQSGTRALKIARDSTRNYWVEFRQSMNGVLIRWDLGERDFRQTELLDMTPSSNPSPADAALLVGQNFYDVEKGIRITVLRKDTTTTPESIAVKVEVNLPPPDCTYSLSSSSYFGSAFTEVVTTNVITRSDCPWTATSNDPGWLTVTSGNTGKGNGTVSITAQPNSNFSRTGTVTIAGKPFSITQASGNCVDTIKPSSTDFTSNGGILTFTHSCNNVTPLSAGTSDWIDISTNPITILPNTGPERNGILKLAVDDINGLPRTTDLPIHQAGQVTTNCAFVLSASGKDFDASGGADIFSLNPTIAGCASTYTAVSNSTWITIANPSGDTGRNISYSVAANSGSLRSGTITVTNPITGSQTFIINQGFNKSRKRVRFFN